MKIGFLTSELNYNSGWANYSLSLIEALNKQGLDVQVVASRNNANEYPPNTYNFLPTVNPPDQNSLLRTLRLLSPVHSAFAGCDIIHATVEPHAIVGGWVSDSRPFFTTIHGSYAHLPQIRRFPVGNLYRRAFQHAHLICVSNYTASVVHDIVPKARISVVPNGINAERFNALQRKPRSNPVVLSVGGVKARKGTLELVRAIAKIREQVPTIRCIIAGTISAEPEYVHKVRDEIQRLELTEHVNISGFVSELELNELFEQATLFVLPSINAGWKFEGFGLVHLQASAAGLPVIGTDNCGVEDAIVDGETGLLISQANLADELPKAILQLLNNPELARKMGEAGRLRASANTWDTVATRMIEIYENSLR